MKRLFIIPMILGAMFAAGQKRLVMDETTMELSKDNMYKLTTCNKEINDSIFNYITHNHIHFVVFGKEQLNPYKSTYYFSAQDTALLNRFFDRMNKK